MSTIRPLAAALTVVLSLSAVAQPLQKRLRTMLDPLYRSDTTCVGIVVHVEAPGISWSVASGKAMKGGEALDPEVPFLIEQQQDLRVGHHIAAGGRREAHA